MKRRNFDVERMLMTNVTNPTSRVIDELRQRDYQVLVCQTANNGGHDQPTSSMVWRNSMRRCEGGLFTMTGQSSHQPKMSTNRTNRNDCHRRHVASFEATTTYRIWSTIAGRMASRFALSDALLVNLFRAEA